MPRLKSAVFFFKEISPLGNISLAVILIFVLMALLAPLLTAKPHNRSSGPPLLAPGGTHPLGTDELGIDLWAQICYGARTSLLIGFATSLLAAFGGGLIGILSGYLGGWIDRIIMRAIDIMIVLPDLPLMIVMAAFLGPSLLNIILILAFFSWVFTARIVRSQVFTLKERAYIKAAETYEAGPWYLIRRHFLPEVLPLVAVSMIRLSGRAIIAEAGLSFLGLGDPTSKSWGLIIHHAINFEGIYFTNFWKWWLLYPLLALSLMVISLAFASQELERVADPRLAETRSIRGKV